MEAALEISFPSSSVWCEKAKRNWNRLFEIAHGIQRERRLEGKECKHDALECGTTKKKGSLSQEVEGVGERSSNRGMKRERKIEVECVSRYSHGFYRLSRALPAATPFSRQAQSKRRLIYVRTRKGRHRVYFLSYFLFVCLFLTFFKKKKIIIIFKILFLTFFFLQLYSIKSFTLFFSAAPHKTCERERISKFKIYSSYVYTESWRINTFLYDTRREGGCMMYLLSLSLGAMLLLLPHSMCCACKKYLNTRKEKKRKTRGRGKNEGRSLFPSHWYSACRDSPASPPSPSWPTSSPAQQRLYYVLLFRHISPPQTKHTHLRFYKKIYIVNFFYWQNNLKNKKINN